MTRLRIIASAVARNWWWLAWGALWFVLGDTYAARRRAPVLEQSRERTATSTGETAMSHKSSSEAINWSLVDDAYQSADVSYYPNGAVKRVRTKARKRQEQKGAVTVTKIETVYVDKHHYHVAEKEKLVLREPSPPRYSIGALGGWSYDGARVYGGTAEVRVGPAWVGVQVSNQAALGSVRFTW